MPDPDIEGVAVSLADYALWLVTAGICGALLPLGAVAVAIRIASRYRPALIAGFEGWSGAYLALHLAVGFIAAAAVGAFAVLAEEALGGGELATFDAAFTRALQRVRTPAWDRVFMAISLLGTQQAIAVATIAVMLVLLLRHERLLALGWIVAQAGGGLLNRVLKETFERARPESAGPVITGSIWSFPSGHAMGTFILCGVGCYLLVRQTRSWTMAGVAVTSTLLWCVLMAFSRLYLGMHFPSDVAAGLVGGVAWVAVCVSGFELVLRRTLARRRA